MSNEASSARLSVPVHAISKSTVGMIKLCQWTTVFNVDDNCYLYHVCIWFLCTCFLFYRII